MFFTNVNITHVSLLVFTAENLATTGFLNFVGYNTGFRLALCHVVLLKVARLVTDFVHYVTFCHVVNMLDEALHVNLSLIHI